MRAVAKDPHNLPHDVLFRDYIRGRGAQSFAVQAPAGEYRVLVLHPDHRVEEQKLRAEGGRLVVTFPAGEWSVSGIVITGSGAPSVFPPPYASPHLERPGVQHTPPATARAGAPLTLTLSLASTSDIRSVRLYYRAVNQLAKFTMLEAAPGRSFTIPAEDISERWDLMYYFEILNDEQGGWFHPDPLRETPYYVVRTIPGS